MDQQKWNDSDRTGEIRRLGEKSQQFPKMVRKQNIGWIVTSGRYLFWCRADEHRGGYENTDSEKSEIRLGQGGERMGGGGRDMELA